MKYLLTLIIVFAALFSMTVHAEIVIKEKVSEDNEKVDNGNNDAEKIEDLKPDIVHFKDKDKMHGNMVSFTPEKGMLWKSEKILGDITFKTETINEIIRGNLSYTPKAGDSAVLLTNDDLIAGELIKLDEKEVVVKTTFAGEIKINRKMVKSIFPGSDAGNVIFRGPNNMGEWALPSSRSSRSAINFKDGELILNYTSAGKNLKLPDISKVEFEMNASSNYQFQIQLYGNKVDRYPRNGYVVYINSGYIYMYRYSNGGSSNLGSIQVPNFRSGKGKVTILSDKKKKSITVLVDNNINQTWTDSSWAGVGGYLTFINKSSSTVKIRDIVVSKWSGKVPGKSSSGADKENDTIGFSNDDVVSGKLISIIDNKVTFKTEYANMDIPIERVKEIVTASNDRHKARRRANDVKLFLGSGDTITLELTKIAGGEIVGESGNFGKATLKLNAFRKIQFNIYDD